MSLIIFYFSYQDNMPRITDHGPAQNQLYAAEEESVTYEIHGQVGYEESITEYNGFEEDAASVTSNVPSSQFTTSDMPYNVRLCDYLCCIKTFEIQ